MFFLRYHFVTAIILSCTAKFVSSTNVHRIVGGDYAPPKFGLFHASLQNVSGHHVCGGAIVSKWHVVTAAHCVKEAQPRYIKIVAGTADLDAGGKSYDTFAVNVFRQFEFIKRSNDVALLTINGEFDLLKVTVLRPSKAILKENDPVTLIGFGAKKPHGESSRVLRYLNLSVFNQQTCRYAMRYTRNVTETMFCTFKRIGKGTCHGDSGSPITRNNELVGLVSWGIPCAVGFPDVHTRIAPYIDWIETVVRTHACKLKLIAKAKIASEKLGLLK